MREGSFAMSPLALVLSPRSAPAGPFAGFRAHFEANRLRPVPAPTAVVRRLLPPHVRRAAAAVLARFQLGEAGEGRVAREIDRIHLPAVDDDYRASLKLFVKEEGRHAIILAGLVRALGGQLLSHKASNHLFRWARRLLGLRLKVLVLLVAELVGAAVYQGLGACAGPGGLRRALRDIAADERHHLLFHAAFLRAQPPPWRPLLRLALLAITAAATLVVVLESGRDLAVCGLSPAALVRAVRRNWRRAQRAAFGAEVQP
jgi:hypothetical protein